jgi:hypothetical protein
MVILATIILENYERIFFSQHKILKLAKVSVIETYLSTCKELIPYGGEMYQVIVATCFLVGIAVKN